MLRLGPDGRGQHWFTRRSLRRRAMPSSRSVASKFVVSAGEKFRDCPKVQGRSLNLLQTCWKHPLPHFPYFRRLRNESRPRSRMFKRGGGRGQERRANRLLLLPDFLPPIMKPILHPVGSPFFTLLLLPVNGAEPSSPPPPVVYCKLETLICR